MQAARALEPLPGRIVLAGPEEALQCVAARGDGFAEVLSCVQRLPTA